MAKAFLVKKDNKIGAKEVIFGDTSTGVSVRKTYYNDKNEGVTLTYVDFDDPADNAFVTAEIDPTHTLILE